MNQFIKVINKCQPLKKFLQRGYHFFNWHIIAPIKLCKLRFLSVKKGEKIIVVFLSQMPALWNKCKLVYEKFKDDDRFKTYILAIPGDFSVPNHNESYDYHLQNGSQYLINAYEDGQFYDISQLQVDYVFYERPYSSLLPKCYKSKNLLKYAKTCYIPYASDTIPSLSKSTHLNEDFISNIYFYFPASYFSLENIKKWYPITHSLHLRKTEWCGYPSLEEVMNRNNQKSFIFGNNKKTIIWTPRWATDEKVVKSNFFIYCKDVLNYMNSESAINFMFRPHPMALHNFMVNGLLTSQEVDSIMQLFQRTEHMMYDQNPDYIASFLETDILITDYSSIIVEYFMLGKPIIYCVSENEPKYSEEFEAILDSCYKAHDFAEIKLHLNNLLHECDELKDKREAVKKKYFNDDFIKNCSSMIKDKIIEDCNRK